MTMCWFYVHKLSSKNQVCTKISSNMIKRVLAVMSSKMIWNELQIFAIWFEFLKIWVELKRNFLFLKIIQLIQLSTGNELIWVTWFLWVRHISFLGAKLWEFTHYPSFLNVRPALFYTKAFVFICVATCLIKIKLLHHAV